LVIGLLEGVLLLQGGMRAETTTFTSGLFLFLPWLLPITGVLFWISNKGNPRGDRTAFLRGAFFGFCLVFGVPWILKIFRLVETLF
jgi:hypothetical protein